MVIGTSLEQAETRCWATAIPAEINDTTSVSQPRNYAQSRRSRTIRVTLSLPNAESVFLWCMRAAVVDERRLSVICFFFLLA